MERDNPGRMKNIVILISGGGSNMAAIVRAAQRENWRKVHDAQVAAVISNRPAAGGLAVAREQMIPTDVVDHKRFETREAFDAELARVIDVRQPSLVVLAGFMRLVGPSFLGRFGGRVVNTHPALLPAFPGAHAVRDALAYGVTLTGCSVIVVDEGVDSGPIVAQAAVPVEPGDDEAALHERIKVTERALLTDVVGRILREGLTVEGRRARIG